ncbi:MAG: M48 family metallopeptidase [Armatimonadetes bacterium]|nr:M48 family metallopeptidase [Armatimonadota bacterium]
MEKQNFEQIVTKMEDLNRRSPESYRAKVARFSALGYGVFIFTFSIVFIALVAIVFYVAANGLHSGSIRLILITSVLTYMFIRAMWVKVEAPEGREVTAEEAPALHAEIERIRVEMGAPEIHKVLLIDDFNAFASTSSKLMIFGERCHVALGLPLLLTQSPREVSATIAHELAHHSKSHVKAGNRAYRLESMWLRLLQQLSSSGSLMSHPLLAFVKWYSPRFSALTLVLRRQAEYEADALGAEATSKEAMALGLLRMSIDHEHRISKYIDKIRKTIDESVNPPSNYFSGLLAFPREVGDGVVETLRRTLRAETVIEDSHPCARERTEALGIEADPENEEIVRGLIGQLGEVDESAAQRFLGDSLERILAEMDKMWQVVQQPEWTSGRVSHEKRLAVLKDFEGRDEEEWTADDAVEYLNAYLGVHEISDCTPRAQSLAARFPQQAELSLMLGYCLLEQDDREGVQHVERAVELDAALSASAHEMIAEFHSKHGDSKAARAAAIKANELRQEEGEKYEKLAILKPADNLLPIEVKPNVLEEIKERLPLMKRVVEAHAFQKASSDMESIKLDMVVLVAKRPMMVSSNEDFIDAQLQEAYLILEGREDVHVQIVADKSPFGKRLASDAEFRFYSAVARADG